MSGSGEHMTHSVSSRLWSQLGGMMRPAQPTFAAPQARNGGLASTDRRIVPLQAPEPPIDVERILARGHSKVIGHYLRLLRNPGLTPMERADIEARLLREENAWLERQAFTVAA